MDFHSLGNTSVVGLQWGDEGKGKIVDLLTEYFDVTVRYAGGANAGHTVRHSGEKFALHLVPSGILRPHVLSVIGPGVALDLEILSGEIDDLKARGVKVAENLVLSNRAHLVMPWHKLQDRLSEGSLVDAEKIGTTSKGIGPCYADKMLRSTALRVVDLAREKDFRNKVSAVTMQRNRLFSALYNHCEPMDPDAVADAALALGRKLAAHITDTTLILHDAIAAKNRILYEGAQGSLLDITHGTFPFVTSSTCTAAGVAAGAGVPPGSIRSYLGVVKAYSTRVGGGPFPTELRDATGDRIRERGHEYGTTTGRPRRCGWFDAFATKYSIDLCGITQLIVMHLDTLSGFSELKICTGYLHRGQKLRVVPPDAYTLAEVEPVYDTLPGWREEIEDATAYDTLPSAARTYLDRLEAYFRVPITLVSVGAERLATLHRIPKL